MILFDAEVTICIYKWLIISVNIFLLDGYHISYLELYACILRKRIRDAALYTFVYHYTFAAKSKSLII